MTVVTFKESVLVFPCLHVNDYTRQEISQTWFSEKDFSEIKNECTVTLRLMAAAESTLNHPEFYSRGLEHRTPAGAKRRLKNKFAVWDAVLNEQDRQFEQCDSDENALAQASLSLSYQSSRAAHMTGICDEQIAYNCDGNDLVRSTSQKQLLFTAPVSRNVLSSHTSAFPIISRNPAAA